MTNALIVHFRVFVTSISIAVETRRERFINVSPLSNYEGQAHCPCQITQKIIKRLDMLKTRIMDDSRKLRNCAQNVRTGMHAVQQNTNSHFIPINQTRIRNHRTIGKLDTSHLGIERSSTRTQRRLFAESTP
jgi:hypothetical protein